MIPTSTIIAFIIALICTFIFPIVLILVLGIKRKINGIPMLLGAVAFFLSQIVLRLPILKALSSIEWYMDFQMYLIPFVLFLSLTAGLFEESARLGGALILKKQRNFKNIISFGLGYGLCEVILMVGFAHINNIAYSIAINNPGSALIAVLPSDLLEIATAQLAAVNPVHVYMGVLERVFAVTFHIFATLLIFRGVIEKKSKYYIYAVAAHTVFNSVTILMAYYVGMAASQITAFILAIMAGIYLWKYKTMKKN